jgi:hypothetical protein
MDLIFAAALPGRLTGTVTRSLGPRRAGNHVRRGPLKGIQPVPLGQQGAF